MSTGKQLLDVVERGLDEILEAIHNRVNDLEKAYLCHGDDPLLISMQLQLDAGYDPGTYTWKANATWPIDKAKYKGKKQIYRADLPLFDHKPDDYTKDCECADPKPISVDGVTFLCFACLHPFPEDAALEYYRIILGLQGRPIGQSYQYTIYDDPVNEDGRERKKVVLLHELGELLKKKRKSQKVKERIDEIHTELAAMGVSVPTEENHPFPDPPEEEAPDRQPNLAAGDDFF